MTRRQVLGVSAGCSAAGLLNAQPSRPTAHIGFLAPAVPDAVGSDLFSKLRSEMERLGWAEGGRVKYVLRFPGEIVSRDLTGSRIANMARELVAANVELIVAMSTRCAQAAKAATTAVPIVFLAERPVENGLVASLAQPGGNATGVTYYIAPLAAKRLQLLTQAVPGIKRVTYVGMVDDSYRTALMAAKALSVDLRLAQVDRADQLESALSETSNVDAWMVEDYGMFFPHMDQIIQSIARSRKPAIYGETYWVKSGGLMAYHDDRQNWAHYVASVVDRVLRGAKPAELPVLEPTRFHLVINQRTAHTLGLTIAPSVILQADEVIE
jgi:putative ABC transport system substrate-binding protein